MRRIYDQRLTGAFTYDNSTIDNLEDSPNNFVLFGDSRYDGYVMNGHP